jgi:hypothetical protein
MLADEDLQSYLPFAHWDPLLVPLNPLDHPLHYSNILIHMTLLHQPLPLLACSSHVTTVVQLCNVEHHRVTLQDSNGPICVYDCALHDELT